MSATVKTRKVWHGRKRKPSDRLNEPWFGSVGFRQGIKEINDAFASLQKRRPGVYT